jgi:nucleotide-binding universal stress UspA family protein
MPVTYVVGMDGSEASQRALSFAKRQVSLIQDEYLLLLVSVVEWSPYKFQTTQENAERKKRKKEEVQLAQDRIIEPALSELKSHGYSAKGIVIHGNAATALNNVATEYGAEQIFVARSTESGFSARVFGSVTANLVMTASVPVTVVN